jgi:hypothetical protein
VLAGIVESSLGQPLAFGDYLLVHFPVLGLAKTLVLIGLLLALYQDKDRKAVRRAPIPAPPPSAIERRLALLLVIALAFWASDAWHHVSPAWIGMAAAVICLLPPTGLLPPKALQTINLEPVFYVGGIISLGALVTHAGLGQRLAVWALEVLALTPDHPWASFVHLCGLSTLVGLLTTLPGVPAVMTPLTSAFAAAGGLTPAAVLAAQVVGFSTVVLPYQAPPLVMAMQAADLPRGEMTRLCLTTAVITILVLWPLDILWLSLLGRL